MELGILQFIALLRPILFIEVGTANAFDIGGIAIILALMVALLVRGAIGKSLQFGAVDALIAMFVLWCVACAVIYPETLDVRGLAKLVTPFIGYTVAKNVIRNSGQFLRIVGLMLVGYILPVFASAALIAMGKGAEAYGANYWTGLLRWEGVYDGAHNMGHNMTFMLMLAMLYLALKSSSAIGEATGVSRATLYGIGVLAAAALYCLWMSQVRTALFGLVIFGGVFFYYHNSKLLLAGLLAGSVGLALLFPILKPYLFPDVVMVERTDGDVTALASGRPEFWKHNLAAFSDLPIDRQIAGAGIGHNRLPGFIDSHNDILDLMVQAGIVGVTLFLAIQWLLFRRILSLPKESRYPFLAMFVAVVFMNLASNSYVARFGLAQMLYVVLAFAELRPVREARVPTVLPERSKVAAGL